MTRHKGEAPLPMATAEDIPKELQAELKDIDLPSFEDLRLGPKTINGLNLMAWEGIDISLAADRVGVRRDNFIRTFRTPSVRKVFNSILKAQNDNAGLMAYVRIKHLAHNATSEHVRLEANKWIAGVEGLAPVKRVEGRVSVNHTFGGFVFEDADVIEGSVSETDEAST